MSTTAVVITSLVSMILVLIGTVYLGLHFSRKSAERRRELEAQQKSGSDREAR